MERGLMLVLAYSVKATGHELHHNQIKCIN